MSPNNIPVPEQTRCLQRIVVVGCAGAGESTFSAKLARRLGVPHVERDALGALGSDTYRSAVADVLRTQAWGFDGPPYFVDDLDYAAAQQVIWLDYSRTLVVWRAVRRAFRRTLAPLPGGEGRLRQWVTPGGPWFANAVYTRRKREFAQLPQRPELASKVVRLETPASSQSWLASLDAHGSAASLPA